MGRKRDMGLTVVEKPKVPRPLKDFRRISNRNVPSQNRVLSTKTVMDVERRYQVIEMRRGGMSIREIAQELNVSEPTISRDLKFVLTEAIQATAETTEEHRHLAMERLDGLLRAYYSTATEVLVTEDGQIIPENMMAAQLVLKIEERRAKLLALDKPENKGGEESGIREYVGVNMDEV